MLRRRPDTLHAGPAPHPHPGGQDTVHLRMHRGPRMLEDSQSYLHNFTVPPLEADPRLLLMETPLVACVGSSAAPRSIVLPLWRVVCLQGP